MIDDKETSMSVKIRLSRGGTKKRPYYYIVVAEAGLAARRALHRADRHAQSAAAQGQRRSRQARPRAGQALAQRRRAADRPRGALPRRGRPRQARWRATTRAKAKPQKKRLEREAAAGGGEAEGGEAKPAASHAVIPAHAESTPATVLRSADLWPVFADSRSAFSSAASRVRMASAAR